jgi:hypothetical protein
MEYHNSNHCKLQVVKNKSLQVIGDYPRGTSMSHLHDVLNIEPIQYFIHQLAAKFFANCPSHPNPLVQQVINYTLDDLNSIHKTYKHKRLKNILLWPAHHQA